MTVGWFAGRAVRKRPGLSFQCFVVGIAPDYNESRTLRDKRGNWTCSMREVLQLKGTNPTNFVVLGTREGAMHLVNIGQITMITSEGNGELLIRLSDGGSVATGGNVALELLATLRQYTILTDGRPVSSLELGRYYQTELAVIVQT